MLEVVRVKRSACPGSLAGLATAACSGTLPLSANVFPRRMASSLLVANAVSAALSLVDAPSVAQGANWPEGQGGQVAWAPHAASNTSTGSIVDGLMMILLVLRHICRHFMSRPDVR